MESKKSFFYIQEIEYFGFIIRSGELAMNSEKIKTIKDWFISKNMKDIRGFLDFTNFYRSLIIGYGEIIGPLYILTKKDIIFIWEQKKEDIFTIFKRRVVEESVIHNTDPKKLYEIDIDVSNFVIGVQLGQQDDQNKLYPIIFFSQRFHKTEFNYLVYNKELIVIVETLKEWQIYLIKARHPIIVYNDYKNLIHFIQTKDLNRRYIRWIMTLSEYNFSIQYRKKTFNNKIDILNRKPDLDIEDYNRPETLLYQKGNTLHLTMFDTRSYIDPDLNWRIKKTQEKWEKKYPGQGNCYLFQEFMKTIIRQIHRSRLERYYDITKILEQI